MTPPLRLFTIGFTQKSAEGFFTSLRDAGVRRVIDVRLNNTSQLAGFAKRDDLRFFLREVSGIRLRPPPDPGANPGAAGRLPEGEVGLGRLRGPLPGPHGGAPHRRAG
jgi:hypothetical protein